MTNNEYEAYFKSGLKAAGIDPLPDDAYIAKAVVSGLKDFWGAWSWRFREKYLELSVTADSTDDQYTEAPDDYGGFKCIVERETTSGMKLQYIPLENFWQYVPRRSEWTAGNPQAFTDYFDEDSGLWRFEFWPMPGSAFTLPMIYLTTAPQSCDAVPDDYQSGLEAYIAKHIFPHGHLSRLSARQEAQQELERLIVVNTGDKSNWVQMQDGTQINLTAARLWTD